MCRHSETTWQTLEPAVIALVTRGVVQLEFNVNYMEWEHDKTNINQDEQLDWKIRIGKLATKIDEL